MAATETSLDDRERETLHSDDLYDVAKTLYDKAAAARAAGDTDASARLLKAAMQVMNDDTDAPVTKGRHASSETSKVVELLKTGWQEVATICETTGLSVNRVHSILARLRRQQGVTLQAQAIKRYRIATKSDASS